METCQVHGTTLYTLTGKCRLCDGSGLELFDGESEKCSECNGKGTADYQMCSMCDEEK